MKWRLLWLLVLLTPAATAADPPIITSVETIGDGLGAIHGIDVHFSHPIKAETVDLSAVSLQDCTCAGLSVSPTNGLHDRITIYFTAEGTTASTPRLVYTHDDATAIRDNDHLSLPSTTITSIDRAAPVLMRAEALSFGRETIELAFSEAAYWAVDGTSALAPDDFAYHDDSGVGAKSLVTVSHTAGSKFATGTLDTGFLVEDDGVDRLTIPTGVLGDDAGNAAGPQSATITADHTAPEAITDLRAAAKGGRSIELTWTAPRDATAYDVRYATTAFSAADFSTQTRVTTGAPGSGTETLLVDGLLPQTHYYFALKSADLNDNWSPMSNLRAGTTLADDTGPAAVVALEAKDIGTNAFRVEWHAPADDGGSVARYDLRATTAGITEGTFSQAKAVATLQPGAPGTLQQAWVTGLEPSTTYSVAIRSIDASGNPSPLSPVLTVKTIAGDAPPEGELRLTSATHVDGAVTQEATVNITWNALGDVTYRFAASKDPAYVVDVQDRTIEGTSLEHDLRSDGTWYLHVAAFGAGGATQAPAFEVVLDRIAPGQVRGLAANASYVGATLSWNEATDAGGIARYDIRAVADGSEDAWLAGTPLVEALGTSAEVQGLEHGAVQTIAIRAVDHAGLSGPISVLEVTTLEDTTPPSAPAAVATSHPSPAWDVPFAITPGEDAETDVEVLAVFDQEPGTSALGGERAADSYEASGPGTWYLHLVSRSLGGVSEQVDIHVTVEPFSEKDLQDLLGSVEVRVVREGDANRITWTLPDAPAPFQGAQLWVGNSPYQLAADLDADALATGSFLHAGEDARETSRYLLTPYMGEAPSLGLLSAGQLDAMGLQAATIPSGGFQWGWVIAPMVIGTVAAGGVFAVRLGWIPDSRPWISARLPWLLGKKQKEAAGTADPAVASVDADDFGALHDVDSPMDWHAEPSGDLAFLDDVGTVQVFLVECPGCAAELEAEGAPPFDVECSCGMVSEVA